MVTLGTRVFDFMTPVKTVLAFLDAINSDDADKVAERITDDHVFIDALGNSLQGREKMRASFHAYCAMCPDYRISREDIFRNGDTVALFGRLARRGPREPDSRVAGLRRPQAGIRHSGEIG
jgi:ketosteroid isomerase-like protein